VNPIADQIDQLIALATEFKALAPKVQDAGRALAHVLAQGGKILTCGNGGSATDALHLSEELVGRFVGERRSLAAISLCADAPLLTCIANDYGFDAIFSRQVEGLGKPGDALVIFSTSGNSANIVQALKVARARQMLTVALLGKTGGKCRGLAEHEIIVPSDITARIQEIHTFVLHAWLGVIESTLKID